MQNFQRLLSQLSTASTATNLSRLFQQPTSRAILRSASFNPIIFQASFSTTFDGNGNESDDLWGKEKGGSGGSLDDLGWDSGPSWSTGLTKDHFDGQAVGRQVNIGDAPAAVNSKSSKGSSDKRDDVLKQFDGPFKELKEFMDKLPEKREKIDVLLRQVKRPGSRGEYLMDTEKEEMYRLHKENPEVYTVEKLAADYRITRQRVHAILYLKEDQKQKEKERGKPFCDLVDQLLDAATPFFQPTDKEFHVSTLPDKPEFKVMPEGWEGCERDPDEVHYEISMKEDQLMYEEFLRRFEFNKRRIAGEIKSHRFSRMRPREGFNFTVERLGAKGKRGLGGGWKFVSKPDGSTRPLNDLEKMFLRRETPRRRRKIEHFGPTHIKLIPPRNKK